MRDFTIAINAGGKSSRMGMNKAFVKLVGKPLIQHVLDNIKHLDHAEIILITNNPDEYAHLTLPMYPDVIPDSGSLGGIYSALHYSKTSQTIMLACDMPFVNPHIIKLMLKQSQQADAIIPTHKGYPQGFHGLYRQSCLTIIKNRITKRQFKVKLALERSNVEYLNEEDYQHIDSSGASFFNINTPDDLKQAEKLYTDLRVMSADTSANHHKENTDHI